MKWICFLIISFCFFSAQAQRNDIPVRFFIDESVRDYDSSTPALLTTEIAGPPQTDRQKVTSIFRWITDNISYNVKVRGVNRDTYTYEQPDDDTGMIIKPLNLRVAETVLRRKKAVCDGYARLFKTMCDHAGIPCEVVTGYARTGWRQTKFSSNHTWNAVYFDSAWHLLDVTWASGYINYRGDEFTQRYDDRYFLTPPAQFVQDHYPEDVRWTLLKEAPVLNEFNRSPLRYIGYIKTGIHSYSPANGIIEASIGDSIRFEANTSVSQGLLEIVTGTQPVDTIWNDDEPVPIIGKKKAVTYRITENSGDWLYVICNGYCILRYKLNIRRPENKMALSQHD
ncbi:MAG: transglutaminase domain-containing protein [Chitinophagales bacterium]